MKRTYFLMIAFSLLSSVTIAQKVGFLLDSYITDRWYIDERLVVDKIKELGGECLIENPYGDPAEQVRLGKKLINESKVDVLIVVASDAKVAAEIVTEAKKANVPVISYDRLIQSNDLAYYISYDNEKVGMLQAEFALKNVPKGNYVLINGPVSDYNGILFRQGQLKVLEPHIKNGSVKLLQDVVLSGWSEMEAMMKYDETLGNSAEQPDAIIAANDALANGAIMSMKKELVGKVIVTGQDADVQGVNNILAGAQAMTIYKPIAPLATRAAIVAMELAKTGKVANIEKVKIGDFEVYAELLAPVVVDQSNYKETVIKDGQVQLTELTNVKE